MVLQKIARWFRREPIVQTPADERPVLEEFIHVSVGSEDRPATDKDVRQVTREMNRLLRTGGRCIVTHHAVHINVVKLSRPVVGESPRKRKPAKPSDQSLPPTILDVILQDKN